MTLLKLILFEVLGTLVGCAIGGLLGLLVGDVVAGLKAGAIAGAVTFGGVILVRGAFGGSPRDVERSPRRTRVFRVLGISVVLFFCAMPGLSPVYWMSNSLAVDEFCQLVDGRGASDLPDLLAEARAQGMRGHQSLRPEHRGDAMVWMNLWLRYNRECWIEIQDGRLRTESSTYSP